MRSSGPDLTNSPNWLDYASAVEKCMATASLMAPTPVLPRAKKPSSAQHQYLQHAKKPNTPQSPACLPLREHGLSYHRPQLLDQPESIERLLQWFEKEEHSRNMPWRQEWINADEPAPKRPRTESTNNPLSIQEQLKRRAYQVWISEIMLQQTRVETVRDYWQSWMDRWPTIEALASASSDDVLSAWRGLGYYSRATRIHQAAQAVVQDPSLQGLLPEDVEELQKKVPGVGRYTAGAISSIVFGRAVPILDGNVARVLSRQIALYADPKAKPTTDLLWEVARLLVERAAATAAGKGKDKVVPEKSAAPGKWNQGLMELGSTLCTPTKPDCSSCPIQSSCLAYAEVCIHC